MVDSEVVAGDDGDGRLVEPDEIFIIVVVLGMWLLALYLFYRKWRKFNNTKFIPIYEKDGDKSDSDSLNLTVSMVPSKR